MHANEASCVHEKEKKRKREVWPCVQGGEDA